LLRTENAGSLCAAAADMSSENIPACAAGAVIAAANADKLEIAVGLRAPAALVDNTDRREIMSSLMRAWDVPAKARTTADEKRILIDYNRLK